MISFGKLPASPGWGGPVFRRKVGPFLHPATAAYFSALAAAGATPLAPAAIDTYIRGLISAGIWDKIKASCLFVGVDFPGCFVPLRSDMPMPDNVNFSSGDHLPTTGLMGNGTSKLIVANYAGNADPQNDSHRSAYLSEGTPESSEALIASGSVQNGTDLLGVFGDGPSVIVRNRSSVFNSLNSPLLGFWGMDRSTSGEYNVRIANSAQTIARVSETPLTSSVLIFARNTPASPSWHLARRLATYACGLSIGASGMTTLRTLQDALLTNVATELA